MSDRLTIYTDGGCSPNPGKGGWAYIALNHEKMEQNSGNCQNTTNNRMELTAVIEAVKAYASKKLLQIHSDSQLTIMCAQKKWKRNKNLDLWKVYDDSSSNVDIEFVWVKGHSGVEYNELADQLVQKQIQKLK